MSSDSPAPGNADVRMSGFAQRTTVEAAIQWVDESVQQLPASEVSLADAAGRVLAESITSPVNVPGFTRSMMDGYAIIASDVAVASMYNPISLQVAGEVLPGQAPSTAVTSGKVIRIMTGAAMPDGADAVIPVEQLQASDDGSQVEVHADVPPGKHVGQVGEDVSAGVGRGAVAAVDAGTVAATQRDRLTQLGVVDAGTHLEVGRRVPLATQRPTSSASGSVR